MKKIIKSTNAPKPVGPYNQAVQAGNFLFISGQIAIQPETGKILVGDIKQQTSQVIKNVKAILEIAGYGFSDIVQVQVYLSSMALFSDFNVEYAKYFEQEPPARVTAGVELMPNALIEIAVTAYKQ
ncbi:MAG: Rid family detoxifying hydrolase [Candidatus Bathyarchaeota archaeon]|nr:Rid family detoxifying hydrolase [Candidatus Bathyarchaeota archaeon]